MSAPRALLFLLPLNGCLSTRPPSEVASVGPERGLRIGDHALYRYQGSWSPDPVLHRQEVLERAGELVTLQVELSKGQERLAWIERFTDSPENRAHKKIDALWELREGERVPLANERDRDVYKLYLWTLPPLRGPPFELSTTPETLEIQGRSYRCSVEIGRYTPPDVPQTWSLSFATCPDLPWQHGPASLRSSEGEVIWSRELLEIGAR